MQLHQGREGKDPRHPKASACWEGTGRDPVTIPVVVRGVMVQRVTKRVKGSIAYLPTTQAWLPPMRKVRRGVLGSHGWGPMEPTLHGVHGQRGVLGTQDVHYCKG